MSNRRPGPSSRSRKLALCAAMPRFDFTLEWAREPRGPAASDPAAPYITAGPTPVEALRDLLGRKLEPTRGSLPILIIDRVERPSEN
jgi:uncharacterized protein (TIGR03435 family)